MYSCSNLTRTRLCIHVTEYNTLKNPSYFIFCLINVLNLISMPIIDAFLLCHVSWVMEIESGSKKISSSQRYEIENLAQYRWDIRYRGSILRVKSPALGSDDSSLDQSATSIQILLQSRDTFLIKLRLY